MGHNGIGIIKIGIDRNNVIRATSINAGIQIKGSDTLIVKERSTSQLMIYIKINLTLKNRPALIIQNLYTISIIKIIESYIAGNNFTSISTDKARLGRSIQ